jgi:hypothetical protein
VLVVERRVQTRNDAHAETIELIVLAAANRDELLACNALRPRDSNGARAAHDLRTGRYRNRRCIEQVIDVRMPNDDQVRSLRCSRRNRRRIRLEDTA